MSDGTTKQRVTLATIRRWVRDGEPFAMLTCYDATTARWLWRGGVKTMLVGDTAAHVILGHDSTLPVSMDFLIEITAAVRRGAPDVFLMGDMPFGSYQCGDDLAMANAARFLKEGLADCVKLEVDGSFVPLIKRMSAAGVPAVAHIGSRPQQVRSQGRYRATFRDEADVKALVTLAEQMVDAGAVMLLIEAVPQEVSQRVVEAVAPTPVIGCGGGPACHGHVVVLHDLLGLTDWHPPFAPAMDEVGQRIQHVATRWVQLVASGQYLKHDHPYHFEPPVRSPFEERPKQSGT
jgi:3-methyl-2-oxobutanoate hydroxymethyltransferase